MGPKRRLRVFLDSNVVFSGLHSPRGAPGKILALFIKGDISVVVSQQVLEEVVRSIKRKLPEALPALRKLLMNAPPEVTVDPTIEQIGVWTDKLSVGDAAVMAAAMSAQPEYFVTGDGHFIDNPDITGRAGLTVVTTAQFLTLHKRS